MIVYADIRTLIVAGLVLFLIKSGWNYPLPLQRKTHVSGKQMIMTRKPCQDSSGNVGACMFKYDCIRLKGVTLSTCVDGFLFGACCLLKESSLQKLTDSPFPKIDANESQKQSNFISEAYELLTNTDYLYPVNYSHPEKEMTNSTFLSSLPDDDVQVSSSTNSAGVSNIFVNESLSPNWLTKTGNQVETFNKSNNLTDFEITNPFGSDVENVTLFESSIITGNNDYNTNKKDALNISTYTPINSYPSHQFKSSDPSSEFEDNWKENDNLFTEHVSEIDLQTESISHTVTQFDSDESKTSPILELKSSPTVSNTTVNFPTKNQYDFRTTTTKYGPFFNEDKLVTTKADFTEITTQKTIDADVSQISNEQQRPTESINVKGATEKNSLIFKNMNSPHTTNSPISEWFTKKRVTSDQEIFIEKHFTTHEMPMPYATKKDTRPSMPHVTKGNTDSDSRTLSLSLNSDSGTLFSSLNSDSSALFSSLNYDPITTTQNEYPVTPQWSAQSILPESFQSLIAQLTSGEVTSPESPVTMNLNFNVQTPLNIDADVYHTPNLSSGVQKQSVNASLFNTSNVVLSEGIIPNNGGHNSFEYFLNGNKHDKNQSYYSSSSTSLKETTPSFVDESFKVSEIDDTHNKPSSTKLFIDGDLIQNVKDGPDTNLETSEFSDEYNQKTSSSHTSYFNEIIKKEYMNENMSSTPQSETVTFSADGTAMLSNSVTLHAKAQLPWNGEMENTTGLATIDSVERNYTNSYSPLFTIFNSPSGNSLLKTTDINQEGTKTTVNSNVPTETSVVNFEKTVSAIHIANVEKDVNVQNITITQLSTKDITKSPLIEENISESQNTKLNEFDLHIIMDYSTPLTTLETRNNYLDNTSFSDKSTENFSLSHTVYLSDSENPSQNISNETTSLFQTHFENSTTSINDPTSPFSIHHDYESGIPSKEINFNNSKQNYPLNTVLNIKNEAVSEIMENVSGFIQNTQSTFTVFENDLDINNENDENIFYTNMDFDETSDINLLPITEKSSSYSNSLPNGDYASFLSEGVTVSIPNFNPINEHVMSQTTPHVTSNETFSSTDFKVPTESYSTLSMDEKEPQYVTRVSAITSTESISASMTFYTPYKESVFINFTGVDTKQTIEDSTFPSSHVLVPSSVTEVDAETAVEGTESASSQVSELTYTTEIDAGHSVEDSTVSTSHVSESSNLVLTSQNGETSIASAAYSLVSTFFSQPTTVPVPKETTENNRWNYKKDCGVRLMQPIGRIVGGKNTYFGKWPWQALVKEATWLGLFVKNKCGGVLITAKYVLTAAHCQPGFFAALLVVLGTHDLVETFDNKAAVIRNVKRMVVHRHYNAQTFENDLALLEMESPVEFSPHVVPICLPHRKEDFTGKMAFVTGWGKLTHGGDVPNILQEVQVPIVANGDCQRMFFHAGHQKAIRSNFVCAGYTNGGQDSCEGDSGGPLMVQREDKRWVLVGTVSHGIGCADPNLPGVYMRMSSYRPWIDSIINK